MDPVLDLAFAADELSDPDLGDPADSIGDFAVELCFGCLTPPTPGAIRPPDRPGLGGVLVMRLDYGFALDEIRVPRFSVEAVEGIGKLFTLATLVLNVLEVKPRVEIVFHGLNPEDPEAKIVAFKEIVGGSESGAEVSYELGRGGQIPGSSSSFRGVMVSAGS